MSRKPVFFEPKNAQMLIDLLKATAEKCRFDVHAFCVMPDHFHALVEGIAPESDLLLFVRNFKQTTSREYARGGGAVLWQKKFFDHILRPKDSLEGVAWYIWMNPVRKGICSRPIQYPFSGLFTEEWQKKVQPHEVSVPTWIKAQVARP